MLNLNAIKIFQEKEMKFCLCTKNLNGLNVLRCIVFFSYFVICNKINKRKRLIKKCNLNFDIAVKSEIKSLDKEIKQFFMTVNQALFKKNLIW